MSQEAGPMCIPDGFALASMPEPPRGLWLAAEAFRQCRRIPRHASTINREDRHETPGIPTATQRR